MKRYMAVSGDEYIGVELRELPSGELVFYKDVEIEIERLRAALKKIAGTDYRGNRSTESEIAWRTLNETKVTT
jgi:hypothetical protein